MKNQGIQKSENEKLLEFGIRLSNLVSDIEELKKDRAKLENLNIGGKRLYLSIRTKGPSGIHQRKARQRIRTDVDCNTLCR